MAGPEATLMRSVAAGAGVVLLVLWAYQSVWIAGWVHEDTPTVASSLAPDSGLYRQRPLTALTWVWTQTPRTAHAVNLGLHLVIGALVGVTAWRLGLAVPGAWCAALIWLLHPMAVETAAYAAGRAEQIVVLGVLIALCGAAGAWWRGWACAAVVGGSLVALGGKEAGVVVLLLVPLVAWARRRDSAWWRPAVVSGAVIAAGVWWHGGLRAVVNADTVEGLAEVTAVTWGPWLLAQSGAAGYWLLASVWPDLLTPDLDVDRLSQGARVAGLAAILALGGVGVALRVRAPVVTLALGIVVLAVIPRLVIQTPRSYLNAHQFAVPFLGLALLTGHGLACGRMRWMG